MPIPRPIPLLRAANTLSPSTHHSITSRSTASHQFTPSSHPGPNPSTSLSSLQQNRPFSSTQNKNAADHTAPEGAHHAEESQYDPPSGWLFGVKPGEKAEKEGWENIWYYGFFGSLGLGVAGYAFKPDTSIQTWALEEARRRLEVEGILKEPETKS